MKKISLFLLITLNGRISGPSRGTGKENEQTLANLSPAEETTIKDEVENDVLVPLLSCFAI